jgi:ribosomal protein RSM22 (predicted rRNA methylase)
MLKEILESMSIPDISESDTRKLLDKYKFKSYKNENPNKLEEFQNNKIIVSLKFENNKLIRLYLRDYDVKNGGNVIKYLTSIDDLEQCLVSNSRKDFMNYIRS